MLGGMAMAERNRLQPLLLLVVLLLMMMMMMMMLMMMTDCVCMITVVAGDCWFCWL
jgi:hypothetical protein